MRLIHVFFVLYLIISITDAFAIKDVLVQGNKRVESATIKSYVDKDIKAFTDVKKANLIKELYETGLFENVVVNIKGESLIITVKENPSVYKISFVGNSRRKKKNVLSKEVHTKVGESLNNAKLSADVDRIRKLDKKSGRFNAKVV